MDKFKSFVPSLLVAVGIVVLGLCVKSGLGSFSRNARVVTVKGLAEKEVKADKVIWPIVYKELGNDLNALYNTINKKNKVVFDLLESKGITVDIISDCETIFPVTDTIELMCGTGRRISVMTPDSTLRIHSEGLVWPLDDVVFDNWWKATLNRAGEDRVKLVFSHRSIALVIMD